MPRRTHPAGKAPTDPEEAFVDSSREWRRIFAEIWGTFLLVAAGAGGALGFATHPDKVSLAMAVVAPGATVMVVIYMLGDVSGAHLNPAVTLAFALRRNFPWARAPGYVVAQLLGAAAAAAFLKFVFGPEGRLGATIPEPGLAPIKALLIEAMLTTGLVTTILGASSGARNVGPNAAIAVGGYIALAGLWAGFATGASMNPARSLAPDLLRDDLSHTWIYIAGPLVGALIAVGFEWILKGPPTAHGTRAAQGDGGSG
ncbi:MAG TPA: aquaporin [Caulobacteraceae bacterium]|nr:aquaporin [Caulobacteraceae bacterium]